MRIKELAINALMTALAGSVLLADVVPGRWEKVDALNKGTSIVVFWKSGETLQGAFESSGTDELQVVEPSGRLWSVPKSGVRKILRQERHNDSTTDGLLGGLGAGLFGGLAMGGACYFATSQETCAIPFAISLGIGAAVGYAIDKAHKGQELLYKAP